MFTNAFFSARPLEAIELIPCQQRAPKPDALWVRRSIERWKTRAFVQEAIDRLELSGHYELASLALESAPKGLLSPDQRRVYERMRLAGTPWVGKQLKLLETGHVSDTGRWIQRAMELAPGIRGVLEDPVWRLIDPMPLTHVEWHELGEKVLAHAAARLPELPLPAMQVVVEDPTGPRRRPTIAFIPTARENSRRHFAVVLLQVRRWEVNGQLLEYYLNLLEALDRLQSANLASCLKILQPEGQAYLATCFGRVHIGFPHASNHEYQQQRLAAASAAFRVAKSWQQPLHESAYRSCRVGR